nr:hypothetical protein [Tanacetum cinerariifolium]
MSSFVSSMLNPISDVGVESIFMTTSSPIVSLETPTPIMTPSTIPTITTSGEAPIPPPTIPSIILENLPTFNSAFSFEERLRSLETSFSEYRQTNQFVDAVSAIPGDGDDEPFDDDDKNDTNDEDLEEEPFEDEEDDEEEHLDLTDSSAAYIARHAALPSPPVPVISPPLPLPSPLTTSPTDIRAPLGYRAAEIMMRALLPSTSRGTDIPEADMVPRKRACLTTLALRFEVGESSAIELDTIIRERTDEFEIRFEEAQDDRALLGARVNTLFKDRPDHRHTAMLMDREAMYARKAWVYSEDRSLAITAHVRTLEPQVVALIT